MPPLYASQRRWDAPCLVPDWYAGRGVLLLTGDRNVAQSIYHAYANMGSQPLLTVDQARELIRTKPTRATIRKWIRDGKRGPDGRPHILPVSLIRDREFIHVDHRNRFLNAVGLA